MNTLTKLTDSELDGITSGVVDGCNPTSQETAMAHELKSLRAQLAELRGQEPVAWRCVSGTLAEQHLVTVHKPVADSWRDRGHEVLPLYAHPVPPATSQPVGHDSIKGIELAVESLKDTIKRAKRFRYCLGSLMNLDDEVASLKKRMATTESQPYTVPTFDEWCQNTNQKPIGWVRDAMRESYDACRAAMLQSGNSELVDFRDRCRKLVGVGARTPDFAVFANIESALRRSNCLSAIERYMSVHVGTDDNDDTPMYRELLNWGEEPAKYIETFKAALPKFSTADYPVVPDGWVTVPVEPTEAMLLVLGMTGSFDSMIAKYQKMLAAAPRKEE